MLKFELILPCYNESKSLWTIVQRVEKAAFAENLSPEDFRLILVENGSQDESLKVMQAIAADPKLSWIKIVHVEKNRGYGFGLWQGLKTATAPLVGWSHADQQCDPADVFEAYRRLTADTSRAFSLIKGSRNGRNWKDRVVSRIFEIFSWFILGSTAKEINAQPKVFDRGLLDELKNPPLDFSFDLYVLYQAQKKKYHIQQIEVDFPPRVHGLSNWSGHFFSRYKTILNMIKYMLRLRAEEGRL